MKEFSIFKDSVCGSTIYQAYNILILHELLSKNFDALTIKNKNKNWKNEKWGIKINHNKLKKLIDNSQESNRIS